MAILDPLADSTAAGIAVKGGATTMSQCLAAATSGRNEEKNARVSASVLYIFQLPAMTRRRMEASGENKDNRETPRPGRGRRRGQRTHGEERRSFVGEGFDAGEFASAEKFEGGTASGGDVRDLVREAALMDCGDGVTAADDRRGAAAGCGGDGFGNFESPVGESRHFEYAHGAVPDDGLGRGNFLAIGVDGLGTDIEAHPSVGRGGNRNRLRRRVCFEFGADDLINRKKQSEFLFLRFFTEAPREAELVVFDERFANGLAFGFEESVSHAAADEHSVGDLHQVFDDFDFVADFGTTKNGDKGAHGVGDRFAEIGQFFFHEQAGGGLLDEAGDANYGSMRAMRGAERVTNEKTVAESGELFRKCLAVLFFLGVEANVFEKEDIAVGERFAFRFRNRSDTV